MSLSSTWGANGTADDEAELPSFHPTPTGILSAVYVLCSCGKTGLTSCSVLEKTQTVRSSPWLFPSERSVIVVSDVLSNIVGKAVLSEDRISFSALKFCENSKLPQTDDAKGSFALSKCCDSLSCSQRSLVCQWLMLFFFFPAISHLISSWQNLLNLLYYCKKKKSCDDKTNI